jgi:UDP-2,3-diacylglucosamine pyrophosphatase LpxH
MTTIGLAPRLRAAVLGIMIAGGLLAAAQDARAQSEQPRLLAFISDLHFGLGRGPDGRWSPREDFRWPKALAGFLAELRRRSDRVDLVIVGDFLELWQPPAGIACEGLGPDAGCTVAEMVQIAQTVIAAHGADFALLGDFAKAGDNRLHIIPGNHDSALLLPPVWNLLAAALDADRGRVALVSRGVWTSPDGRVVAEHGHQVGNDVNRYPAWPRITTDSAGTTYLVRPWGERFVQRVFNSQEDEYEIIDNVAPETVGVKYRIAERGYAKTAADVALFIAFNLFETSFVQKLSELGGSDAAAEHDRWDVKRAREEIGALLFLEALDPNDPLRAEIETGGAAGEAVKAELAALARDESRVSDDDVRALCDHLTLRKSAQRCNATAGALLEADLRTRRHVMRGHLAGHLRADERLRIFIYGHTHALEEGWQVAIAPGRAVTVHNTGAFQRTMDEKGFIARMRARNLSPNEALRAIKLEELPPCYTAVLVTTGSGAPQSKTWRWHMPEDGTGTLVEPGDPRCD